MAFEPHLVLDQHGRNNYARTLLDKTVTRHDDALPLALYLFLLEALAYIVAADRTRGEYKRPISGIGAAVDRKSPVHEDETGQSATYGRAGSPAAAATDRGASGTGAVGAGGAGAERTEVLAPWHAWIEYLAEVYLYPLTSTETSAPTSDNPPASSWTSPLHLPSDIVSYLQHLPSSPVFDDSTRTLLLAACRSAITHLSPRPPPSASPAQSSSQTTLNMLMTETASPSFPRPLPTSTVSSISLVLAAQRKAAVERTAPPAVSRQVVCSLLHHYVSPSFQQHIDINGETRYADDKTDDRLMKQLFSVVDDAPEAVVEILMGGHPETLASEDDDEEDKRSIRTGIRDAQATISRKENKIRQLLGDNWQQGPHGSPSSSSISPSAASKRGWNHRSGAQTPTTSFASSSSTVRPQASMSTLRRGTRRDSDESLADEGSPERSLHNHQRLVSTSSSQTPLIDSNPTLSTSSTHPSPSNHRSFLHRRGASTQGGLIYAPSSLTLPTHQNGARPGAPPLSAAISTPPLQGDHLSPSTSAKPFQDYLPPSTDGRTRAGPPSPRRTSLDSSLDYHCGTPRALPMPVPMPLNRNALTPHEKRELVRRSKKLEGFFGATFQEEAAQRVLVDGRAQGQAQVVQNRPVALSAAALSAAAAAGGGGAESASPTNASFPPPATAPPATPSAAPSSAAALPPASRPSVVSSASPTSRRPSLAPPSPHHHAVPSPSYQFEATNRRASVLSHSSSFSSLAGGGSPTRSPSLQPHRPSLSVSGGRSPSGSIASSTGGIGGVRMHRSSSSPSRRSSSFSSLTSPDYAYFSLQPRRMSAFEREELKREREERRRKLEKVRRVLGERVPVQLVCGGGDGEGEGETEGQEKEGKKAGGVGRNSPPRASQPMAKSRSAGGVGGLLKGVAGVKLAGSGHHIGHAHHHLGGAKDKGRALPPPTPTGGDAGWQYVQPAPGVPVLAPPVQQHSAGPARRQGLEALTKARKLENMFGDLPPQSLYLSPQASSASDPLSAGRPDLSSFAFRHRRSFSDLAGTASRSTYHPSPSSAAAINEEDPFGPSGARPALSVPLALRRFTTNSTVNSYRQSIASLGYIADRDPAALDDIARVYEDSEGGRRRVSLARSHIEGAGDDEEDEERSNPGLAAIAADEEPDELDLRASMSTSTSAASEESRGSSGAPYSRSGADMERSVSAGSHRAVRQAQKLSAFFGTTRGEIWSMLLNDIQASIEDDPALDEEEREEVLAGVERLRQKVRV
ncbi:hypothetical protein JCM11251_007209 [Rhodosporidiobolus azoricus]